MNKRYQVFISSTFEDLKEERQAVLKAVLEMDHMPAGMELFPPSDETAWRLICDVIDSSDYYALIIGGRYGSLDEAGIGFTEKEYDYAIQQKKPVIPMLHSDPDNLPRGRTETDPMAWKKLQEFRRKVEAHHTCKYWQTAEDLRAQVIVGLTAAAKRHPAEGWVRAGMITAGASQEILELKKTIESQQLQIERLGQSPPVGSELLAQGADLIEVEYRVTIAPEGLYTRTEEPKKVMRKVSVTWDELFGSFAPLLTSATPEKHMKSQIVRFLREKDDVEIKAKRPGYTVSAGWISDELFQTIKVQFTALGLIESASTKLPRKEKKAEGDDVRGCVLTPLGFSHMVRVKAIMKPGDKAMSNASSSQ
jgi:hypothetical protein